MFRCLALLVVAASLAARAPAQENLLVPFEYATIQIAVSSAADGDTILVSAGTYEESVVIAGFTNLTLRGLGKVVIAPPTGPGLLLDGCDDLVIEHIRVQGGDPGILLLDTDDSLITRCRIEGATGDGIRVEGGEGDTFERCIVTDAQQNGFVAVELAGALPQNLDVSRCKFVRPFDAGVELIGGGHVVERCRVVEPGGVGINSSDVEDSDGVLIERCRVIRPIFFGIIIGGEAVRLVESKVVRAEGFAILLGEGTGCEILDCRADRPGYHGIVLSPDAESALIADCRISRAGEDGIYLDGSGHVVQDNRMTHSVDDGLDVYADACTITGNRISGSTGDGIALTEGADNLLSLNEAHGSGSYDFSDIVADPTNVVDDTNEFGTVGP